MLQFRSATRSVQVHSVDCPEERVSRPRRHSVPGPPREKRRLRQRPGLGAARRQNSAPILLHQYSTRSVIGQRVIFLDVDGVLNTHYHGRSLLGQRRPGMTTEEVIRADLHEGLIRRFARVCKSLRSVVVLSSAWRLEDEHWEILMQKLQSHGIEVVGETISLPIGIMTQDKKRLKSKEKARCIEILYWLKDHGPVANWVVVDDMDLWTHAGPYFFNHMVQTKPLFGFTEADAEELERCMTSLTSGAAKVPRGPKEKPLKRVTKGLGQSDPAVSRTEGKVPKGRTISNGRDSEGRMAKIPELFGVNPDVGLPQSLSIMVFRDGTFAKPRRRSLLSLFFGFVSFGA